MGIDFPDYQLSVRNFETTEPRFAFPGVSRDGHCFLKIKVQQGTPVFLCVQLQDYTGTSVTNAVEDIFSCAIRMLLKNDVVISTRKKSFRDFISEIHFDTKKNADIYRFFSEKTVWIEHYPPNTGLSPGGSYALVKFDSNFNPSWSYVRRETAVRASGLDSSFFNIPYESLVYDRA